MSMIRYLENILKIPDALSRSLDLLLAILRNRAELFSLELREESVFLVKLILYVAGACFFLGLSVVMLTFTVVFSLEGPDRLLALAVFTVFYLLAGIVLVITGKRAVNKKDMPFAETLRQLQKDRDSLK